MSTNTGVQSVTCNMSRSTGAHTRLAVSDLSPDQLECYNAIKSWLNRGASTKRTLTLGGYAGCLVGETIVKYNRATRVNSRDISLRDLYLKFNGYAGSGRGAAQRWVDLTMPTYMPSLWPDGRVGLNRVVAVLASGVKKVFRVEFSNGKRLMLTADHPIAVPGFEYVATADLEVGDRVLAQVVERSGKGVGRRIDLRPPRVIVNTKYHPGPTKTVWCNGIAYDYVRVSRARLVVEAAMNDLTYEEFVHALKHNAAVSKAFKFLPVGRVVDVHHIDENTLNDDISNLEVLPHSEHARLHGRESEAHFRKCYHEEVKVTHIQRAGEAETFDVQMEPPANNFVANGIFVHNSGKSALVSVIAHEMPSPLALCAFTGKASSVLGRKLAMAGIETVNRIVRRKGDDVAFEPRPYCGTIHGLVFRPCDVCMKEDVHEHTYGAGCREDAADAAHGDVGGDDPFASAPPAGGKCLACDPPPPVKREGPCHKCGGARYLRRDSLDRGYRLIVVDEASMVSDEMLQALLSYNVPILAVGDHGQLPPVKGQGSLMRHPDLKLEKIHRQAEKSPIIALSKRIRETGDIDDSLEDGEAFTVLARRDLKDWIARRWNAGRIAADPRTPAGALGSVLVTSTNRARCNLNYDVREALGIDGPPSKGEPVICLKNAAPIYNGMRGVLTQDAVKGAGGNAPKWKMTVDFVEDGQTAENVLASEHQFFAEKTIDFDAARALGVTMSNLGSLYDFGYSLTCHKMQGSSAHEVGVVLENMGWMTREDQMKWKYTAVTRSAERLTVIR